MISSPSISQPNIKSKLVSHSSTQHTLVIEPLMPGYGYTLGNSIRRVLLSSIPGSAATRLRINEITHEYQPIEGVVEDALDVILNIKLFKAKILTSDDKVVINLSKNTSGEVFASDFDTAGKVEIVNPDLYICHLNEGAKLDIELEVSNGVGYLSLEEIDLAENTNPQDMYLDAVFSPVVNVALNVEQVRVGEKTNFDQLEVSFETDKSVDPRQVVEFVLKNLIDLLNQSLSSFKAGFEDATDSNEVKNNDEQLVNDISLPTRIKNILEKNGIVSNAELVDKIKEIEGFAGITEKSYATIKDYIKTIS
ncbi:MAG: DNA-directed RNA polymerase subunit alpha [Patescibacteria group bacterium]